MSDLISFVHTFGGLISDSVLAELLNDKPKGSAAYLAEPSTFQLESKAPNARQLEEDIELAYRTAEASWTVLSSQLDDLDVSRLRERLLLLLLRELGFDPQYQQAHVGGMDNKRYAITHFGWDGPGAPPMILTNLDLDHKEPGKRSPHQELQAYLNVTPIRWGIAANGRELRVLRDFHHTTAQGAVVFDLADLLEAGAFSEFRALYRLAHASRFSPAGDENEPSLLEHLYQDSLSEGVQVGKALQPQVRKALVTLLNGLLDGDARLRRRLTDEPGFGRVVYGELLTVLYRILFLMFSEQRGLLTNANDIYVQSYSVTRLRDLAESRQPEPRRKDLWEGLKATFKGFSGDEDFAAALGVYPYNGNLFNLERTTHINEATCTNRAILDAFRSLTTVEIGRVRQYVDYRHIGVEELGSVYESLLNYTIRIAEEPITVEGSAFASGQAYLSPLSIERSELGAYYTPPKLVELTLSKVLDDMIADRQDRNDGDPAAQEEELLNLRIIDPACGSAAFLVGAIDRVAVALADVRTQGRPASDRDLQRARRDVLEHCVYGADVDPFAVELAKVALWIHCAVDDLPLTFLDHKIVTGNSLVGWPLFELPKEIPAAAYEVGLKGTAMQPYRAARDHNNKYLSDFAEHQPDTEAPRLALQFLPLPDISLSFPPDLLEADTDVGAVRRKAEAHQRYLESEEYLLLKHAADTWTAAFFWSTELGPFPSSKEYHQALSGEVERAPTDEMRALLGEVNPLHWPLAFPDIYHRGGFDLVVGNPPWEKFVTGGQEYFAAAGRFDIAEQTSSGRKAAIRSLAEGDATDVALLGAWVRHKHANDRMSHFAKRSKRFTPVPGEVNTYVLFTELAADLSGERGSASIVVKSGIAVDKTPSAVWTALLDQGRVRGVLDIVNHGQAVFNTVAAVERFSVISLGPPRPDSAIEASMLSFSLDEAASKEPIVLTASDIEATNPYTRTLLSARTKSQYDVAVGIHRRAPLLDLDGTNLWRLRYATSFHSSGDSDLFLKREELEAEGWVLGPDRIFRNPPAEALPVLEGQMVTMFDHRVKSYEHFRGRSKYSKKPNVPLTTDDQKRDPLFEGEPRYWMLSETARQRLDTTVGENAQVAIRDVGAPWTNQRSARAALVCRYPVTHTIPQLVVPLDTVHEFVGVYNSTTFDYLARVHMPGGHLAMTWLLSQIAIPAPALDPRISEISERLSVTSRRLADDYGFTLHPWDPGQRENDQIQLDALVAKTAYELTVDEYEIVLDSFDVMKRAQVKEHGEYRFKRLCLEAFNTI